MEAMMIPWRIFNIIAQKNFLVRRDFFCGNFNVGAFPKISLE